MYQNSILTPEQQLMTYSFKKDDVIDIIHIFRYSYLHNHHMSRPIDAFHRMTGHTSDPMHERCSCAPPLPLEWP